MSVKVETDVIELALRDYESRVLSGADNPDNFFKGDTDPGTEPGIKSALTEETLKYSEEIIKDGATWFDEWAKGKGLSGMGDISPERFSRVAFLVAKKRIPESWLENSPELYLGSMTVKILGSNMLELQRLKNKSQKETGNAINE